MDIARDSRVSDVATEAPATIRVFQQHGIDFCCGGKRPLTEACAEHGVDVDVLVAELRSAAAGADDDRNWLSAPLPELIGHIQERFHGPLRTELPRLAGMMAKVVSRHGEHLPEILHPLYATLMELEDDLLRHMAREDAILFPAIAAVWCTYSSRPNRAVRTPGAVFAYSIRGCIIIGFAFSSLSASAQ